MNNEQKHSGFSLTEVLIAVGILAVGMTFVAGVFPAGIYLMTIATERTIAAVAADEAFAKIKIYAIGDLNDTSDDIRLNNLQENELMDFNDTAVFPATINIDPCEFAYPSTNTAAEKQYYWTALCRGVDTNSPDGRLVQVTVFISRKVRSAEIPTPRMVGVSGVPGSNLLTITDAGKVTWINDGYTIVDDATGRIYRVLERYKSPNDNTILLDRNWEGTPEDVWVVPPPVGGGRYPCIAVYQKVIRF